MHVGHHLLTVIAIEQGLRVQRVGRQARAAPVTGGSNGNVGACPQSRTISSPETTYVPRPEPSGSQAIPATNAAGGTPSAPASLKIVSMRGVRSPFSGRPIAVLCSPASSARRAWGHADTVPFPTEVPTDADGDRVRRWLHHPGGGTKPPPLASSPKTLSAHGSVMSSS
jgi:hypothetical protein